MESLYSKLISYGKSDYYPFHMPGHKRNTTSMPIWNIFEMDITEIDGFDNLDNPKEILRDAMDRAALLYKARASYYLVNGSTVGILSAISTVAKKGERILMGRNSHKAVFNAALINELESIYIYPELIDEFNINGGLLPEKIEEMLIKYGDIKAIVITSPTYEGVVSDVEDIAKIAHKYKVPLIVDEAHGAHFGFIKEFPESSIGKGADIVIQSLHKTLPALTQTSILHLQGDLVDKEKLEKYLGIYQTSSPSYILLASIDYCINLMESEGIKLMNQYNERLTLLRDKLKKLKNVKLLGMDVIGKNNVFDLDPSKLLLSVKGTDMTGKELYDILRIKYHLQLEMKMGDYVLAMTSLMDNVEGYERLYRALEEIDGQINKKNQNLDKKTMLIEPLKDKLIYEADYAKKRRIPLDKAVGKTVGEFIYLYPPGTPLIVPGEIISEKLLKLLDYYESIGLEITGLSDESRKTVLILK